jgi:hypothetical protein
VGRGGRPGEGGRHGENDRDSRPGGGIGRRDVHRDRASVRDKVWSVFSPTSEPPRSALNLRMALAAFGLVISGVFAAAAVAVGLTVLAIGLAVLAVIA